MRQLTLSLLLLLSLHRLNAAQEVDSRFQYTITTMDTTNGLPQSDVNRIYFDNLDFIWVATNDGVGRYDGDEFTYYHSGESGLQSNMFIDISQDGEGFIYLLSVDKGIFRYDPQRELFTQLEMDLPIKIADIECDRYNNIWLRSSDNKLYKMVAQSECNLCSLIETDITAQHIILDSQDELIAKNKTTLYRLSPPRPTAQGDEAEQKIEFERHYIANINYIHIIERAPNNQLLSASGGMLYKIDMQSNRATPLFKCDARKIYTTKRGDLIISSSEGVAYSLLNSDGTYSTPSIVVEGNIIATHITEDRVGTIWIGTYRGGVIKFEPHSRLFNSLHLDSSVESIYEDSQHNLWLGSMDGSLRVQREGNHHIEQIKTESWETPPSIMISTICEHPTAKKLYLGCNNFIYSANIGSDNFRVDESLSDLRNVCRIIPDERYLWIASYTFGLILYDTESREEVLRVDREHSSSLLENSIVRNVIKDSDSNIWFGTQNGLYRIDAAGRFDSETLELNRVESHTERVDLSGCYIMPIMEDVKGDIWVGTLGSGLFRLNPITAIRDPEERVISYDCEQLTTKSGLSSNTIKALIEDDKESIWATTNNGVLNIDRENLTILSYGVNDGLLNVEFCELSTTQRHNGEIVLGGVKGINTIQPEQYQKESIKPSIEIVEMSLLNEVVEVGKSYGDRAILTKSILYTTDLELYHNQNSFKFRFASPLRAPYGNPRYQYKLEGFDEDWVNCSLNNRDAIYTNLAPGRYRLDARTSNDGHNWSDTRSIEIHISPSRWVSHGAIIGYIILLITALRIAHLQYKRVVKNRHRIIAIEREKEYIRKVTKSNLELFSNVSHELRTPLTLIISNLQYLLSSSNHTAEQQENLRHIEGNSSMMLRLINDLLNITKIEYKSLNIELQRSDLVEFSYHIVERFKGWAEKKDVKIEFYGSTERIYYLFDLNHMESILYNLLSNAMKYTPNGGMIIVEIDSDNDITICISNTGEGITEEESKQIFNRYYRASQRESESSTGIGLSLTKKLVEMHGGAISFDSKIGESTTFTITLPIVSEQSESDLESLSERQIQDETELQEDTYEIEKIDIELPTLLSQPQRTILVVDDNTAMLELLSRLFSNEYQVVTADDGLKGLQKCVELQPSLVITDYMMPNIDGVELCRRIKEQAETSHIPVVMLTANAIPETQAQSLKVNVDAFCLKPFDNEILRSTVRSILVNRERMAERFKQNIEQSIYEIGTSEIDNKLIADIVEYVNDNANNALFSIEEMCKELKITQIKLSKKIRDLTGQTLVMFIRRVKLRKAARLLASGEYTVSEATYLSGFNDLKHFRTIFKEEFGVLPNEFANRHKR